MALAIREKITGTWRGTASDLLGTLTPEPAPKDWPSTPQGMGGRLVRAAPALGSIGWIVEAPDRSKRARQWHLISPNER